MNEMQALIDGMSAQWQRARAETQMTLGQLIEKLEAIPSDAMVAGITNPHSCRGYYCDLAFEVDHNTTAGEALEMCRACLGEVFEGYKGGDFQMGKMTPVWVASYGDCGDRIVGLTDDGRLITAPDAD